MKSQTARLFSQCLALAALSGAFLFSFLQAMPEGSISGRVTTLDTGKPLSHARVSLTPEEYNPFEDLSEETDATERRNYTAVTDADGVFKIKRVAADYYRVAASSRAHAASGVPVWVDEDQAAKVELAMKRSQPDLQMSLHQRVFLSSEPAHIPVHGYVDGAKPAGADSVKVRVFRSRLVPLLRNQTTATALQRLRQTYRPQPGIPRELLHPKQVPAPQLVAESDIKIKEADSEGFYHKRLPVKTTGAGVYMVEVSHGKNKLAGYVQVTNTGLIVKRAPTPNGLQMLAYNVDLQSGAPRPGATVRVYRDGKQVAERKADDCGLAELLMPRRAAAQKNAENEDLEDDNGYSRYMVVAMRGEEEEAVSSEQYGSETAGGYTLAAYTDRPIYRPGQRIYWKGIVRRALDPGMKYLPPANAAVKLQMRDPQGVEVYRGTQHTNAYGSFHGLTDLSPEAATGVYELIAEIGGERHTQDIVVASYQKPEFTVKVTPHQARYRLGETAGVTISGEYYFGAPVVGAKVHYYVYRDADWESEYPSDYGYDDLDEEEGSNRHSGDYAAMYGERVTEGEAVLDETGKADLEFALQPPSEGASTQAQIYNISATVSDAARREVEASGDLRATAGDFRLSVRPEGYVAKPDAPAKITVVATDYNGKPVPNTPIELESGYWSYESKTGDDTESKLQTISFRRAATDAKGKVILKVTPPRSGELRLEARARDAGGRPIRGLGYLWVSGDRGGDLDSVYDDLSLMTDQRRYQPGQTARVLINARNTGAMALLTIEGSRVYRSFLVPLRQRSTIVKVPVLGDYGPNVYLAACYVRHKEFARSSTPLRVTVPQREVAIKIEANRYKHGPGDLITYKVHTADHNGRALPCEVSLGVVDESIYALREDDPKVLREAFYPRRSSDVSTSFSHEPEYLGDANKAEPQIVARKKFPDTAYWAPDVVTDSRGNATVSFTLPDNLTTWRATAVAHSMETALGFETKKVLVAKDFLVRLEKPRFMTQGDQSVLQAIVHNDTPEPREAKVRLESPALTFEGDAIQRIVVPPGQHVSVMWPVTVADYNDATVKVSAWTVNGDESAGATAETPALSDAVEVSLPVRPHGRVSLTGSGGEVTSQKPAVEEVVLDPRAVEGNSRLTVRLTPSVVSSLMGALEYLTGYPYGCTEQTLSRFLPDIQVGQLLRIDAVAQSMGPRKSARLKKRIPGMVRDGLTRLYRFQQQDGGWGWWENDTSDPWMTAYTLYGLGVARQAGYKVDEDVLSRGRTAGVKLLGKARGKDKAFLLYALALAGERKAVESTRTTTMLPGLGSQALSYLVLTDKLMLDTNAAPTNAAATTTWRGNFEASWAALNEQASDEAGLTYWEYGAPDADTLWDNETATATALRAMMAHDRNDPRLNSVLRWLMLQRTGDYWESTLDTSFVLGALCEYLTLHPEFVAPGGVVSLRLNGKTMREVTVAPTFADRAQFLLELPASAMRKGRNRIELLHQGKGGVYYHIQLKQTVVTDLLAADARGGLKVQREYFRMVPQANKTGRWILHTEPVLTRGGLNRVQQGHNVRVRVTIQAPRDLNHVLIEDAYPAGCEPTERGGSEMEYGEWSSWYSQRDVRDDRIAFFARRMQKGKHVFEYNLRAQTPGTYRSLPTLVQEMYSPEVRAESAEDRVQID